MSGRGLLVAAASVALLVAGWLPGAQPARGQRVAPSLPASCGAAACPFGTCGDVSSAALASSSVAVRERWIRHVPASSRTSGVRALQSSDGQQAADTPGSKTVQIWFLFGWDGEFGTSQELVSAVNGYYQPVIQALKNNGYDAPQEHISRFEGSPRHTSITLDQFISDSHGAGVLIIDGHAKSNFLPVQICANTAAGRKAANDAFRHYRSEGYSHADLGGKGPIESADHARLSIGLTQTGIADHLQGVKDALVFLGMCHGTRAALGFVQAGALAAVAWSQKVQGPTFAADIAHLLSHMDGVALAAPSLKDNRQRVLAVALGACTECSRQMGIAQETTDTGVTLAPSVVARSPDPTDDLEVGTPFTVSVTFDTVMASSGAVCNQIVTFVT